MSIKFIDRRWGGKSLVQLVVSGFYTADGSPRLDLVDAETGEPHATCTVCQGKSTAPQKGCVFIKNYSENAGIDRLLIENGVIESLPNGMVFGFPMYKLTPAVLEMVEAARAKEAA